MNTKPSKTKIGFTAITASLLFALSMAVVTAMLLLINGSIVLVALKSLSRFGPEWMQRPSILQFLLFTIPVMMTIMQWMTWDVIRGLFQPTRKSIHSRD